MIGEELIGDPLKQQSRTSRLRILEASLMQCGSALLVSSAIVFLMLAAVQPFAHNLRALAKDLILSILCGAVFVVSRPLGARPLLVFHFVLYSVILYVDRSNFGVLSAHEAFIWTALVMLCFCTSLLLAAVARYARSFTAAVSMAFQASLLAIPFTILAYNLRTGARFSEESIRAVLQTNAGEAFDFARQFIGVNYGLMLIGLLAAFLPLTLRVGKPVGIGHLKHLVITALVLLAVLLASLRWEVHHFRRGNSNLAATTVATFLAYRAELRQFRDIFNRKASELPIVDASREGAPRTFVVIVGESQNKDHMGAYGYHRNTTPWLSHAVAAGHVTLFENAYSSHTLTVNVLGKALTEATQYNGKQFYTSASLVDVANASAFKTVWITNHPIMGAWDNIVAAIGGFAGSFIKLNSAWGFRVSTEVYDEAAVEALRTVAATIDSSQNNLIVVHLMGNHTPYCDQFPPDRGAFTVLPREAFGGLADSADLVADINCYDNSIAYNDYVAQELFKVGRAIPNIGFIFYFADHADAVTQGRAHNPDLFDFEMTRIPMFIWFADQYAGDTLARVKMLQERAAHYFTNDMVYDTLLGLMGVSTSRYSTRSDFSAASFSYAVNDLRTLDGQRRVTEDPLLVQRAFVSGNGQRQILARRSNTLGMMQDARSAGFAGFEMDVVFRAGDTAEGDFFEVSLDGRRRLHGTLDEYLSYAGRIGFDRIVLNLDSLHDANVPRALDALEALSQRHEGFRQKAVLEFPITSPTLSLFRSRGWHSSYELANDQITAALARGDGASRNLARRVAQQVASQNADAISFDVTLYSFVSGYLTPLVKPDLVYHGRAASVSPWLEQTIDELRSQRWFRDERIVTLQVPVLSDFQLK